MKKLMINTIRSAKRQQYYMTTAILIVILFAGFVTPAMAEEVIWDYTAYEFTDTSGSVEKSSSDYTTENKFDQLHMTDISLYQNLYYVVVTIPNTDAGYDDNNILLEAGRHEFTYSLKDQHEKLLIVYIDRYSKSTRFTMFFEDWDIESLSGPQRVDINGMYFRQTWGASTTDPQFPVMLTSSGYTGTKFFVPYFPLTVDWVSGITWQNHIKVTELDPNPLGGYEFSLIRNIDGKYSQSTCKIYNETEIIFNDSSTTDIRDRWFSLGSITQINIESPTGRIYKFPVIGGVDPATPDTASVTVYVKNSQTGAAIANSNVVIDALVNGEYYPVANTTEPSGIFTINLQPTGGGQPNPDSYRLIATADGYNNPMPEINFTVTDSKKYIYCYLDPIAGGPENENNTFIDFYVRDLSANPVSGATVKFGKYTLITNSQGYTVFEVPKNTDYTYTVSKSGYGPVTGNANIGANDRYIINAVIGPSVTPTAPTAIPTATQTGPTPTLTAPTGEPVSNLLEWFAAHFGMLLGGGVEIGKIFMWLCFTVPVGVYVGKEAKAGAAGFMGGAGIVTLFFVIIGWVPIWIVVLLALIIGLLYAKVFNNSDNGGGR